MRVLFLVKETLSPAFPSLAIVLSHAEVHRLVRVHGVFPLDFLDTSAVKIV
jgi:hypothetical protein